MAWPASRPAEAALAEVVRGAATAATAVQAGARQMALLRDRRRGRRGGHGGSRPEPLAPSSALAWLRAGPARSLPKVIDADRHPRPSGCLCNP